MGGVRGRGGSGHDGGGLLLDAEQLAPYLGEHWSKATFSAAERSIDGARIRQFTADDVYAFARTFGVPTSYFLCPPLWAQEIGHAASTESTSAWDFLDLVFDVGEHAGEWLLAEAVPMTAQTTRALRRWRDHLTETVGKRDREVALLLEEER